MRLFEHAFSEHLTVALIAEVPDDRLGTGVASAAFERLASGGSASGSGALQLLLPHVLSGPATAVAISLNPDCVFDRDFLARLGKALADPRLPAGWVVLASAGMDATGDVRSVVYASASPRLFTDADLQPIVDAGLDFFVVDAGFLRERRAEILLGRLPAESLPQWCILNGYLEGRLSLFHPQLAIGVDGHHRGRDHAAHAEFVRDALGSRFTGGSLPSLSGPIPLEAVRPGGRDTAALPPPRPLAGAVAEAAVAHCTPVTLSIVVRTRFDRGHLLRRLLASLTRARRDDVPLQVVLSTDMEQERAEREVVALRADFRALDLKLQVNDGGHGHSRVDNLLGGILACEGDYIALVDDDDHVAIDAFASLRTARFLGSDPLLIMATELRNERWIGLPSGEWVLESARSRALYSAAGYAAMFDGVNQLPICAFLSPRQWMQDRVRAFPMRHDLSEDYTLYLLLLTAPDLPRLQVHEEVFCLVSERDDGSNTITMVDRRPWVRDITLFLHDLCVNERPPGVSLLQLVSRARPPRDGTPIPNLPASPSGAGRNRREVALLRAEADHLRALLLERKPS